MDIETTTMIVNFLQQLSLISPQGRDKFREALSTGWESLPKNEDDSTWEASHLFGLLMDMSYQENT